MSVMDDRDSIAPNNHPVCTSKIHLIGSTGMLRYALMSARPTRMQIGWRCMQQYTLPRVDYPA